MRGPIIGVDIGGTKMVLTAEWFDGHAPETLRLSTGEETHPEEIEHYISRFVSSLGQEPRALGIAVPGLVDRGRVVACDVLPALTGWEPANLGDRTLPVTVLNDVAAALAEGCRALPPAATAALVAAGTGIGMAFMSDGRTFDGSRGWAGELGSMPVRTGSGTVHLDAVAGGAALVARSGDTPAGIHAALAAGDPRIRSLIHDAGEAFGLALATVIGLVNPEFLLLSGGTLTYDGYLDTALETARRTALPELWNACTLRRPSAADPGLVVARGAARRAAAQRGGVLLLP
ncbi:ROK family protein [Streptomyces sp. NPDC057424]|uniref:ROK family protein n=1 Tax=Streptomyces sp. NPDC057424 TaxID=3346127 RepID=UPI0036743018